MKRKTVALTLLLCVVTASGHAATPVPFEAVYEIAIKNWKMPGEIENFAGSQIVRVDKTCTDWNLAAQFRLVAQSANGDDVDFGTDLSGTESLDGNRYRFRSETRMRNQTLTLLAGTASRPVGGQAGRITFSEPERRTVSLPHDALFPVASFVWTARQWERGQKTANYVLFDGTTPEPVRVFELVTGTPMRPSPMPEGDIKLLDANGWRTTGSFHAYSGQESAPLTTLTQTVLANGVATELSIDIGIADVTLQLRRIRALKEPRC
jgi:hypothetical protein